MSLRLLRAPALFMVLTGIAPGCSSEAAPRGSPQGGTNAPPVETTQPDAGSPIHFPDNPPELPAPIEVIPNRGGVTLVVPEVAGAMDYRVYPADPTTVVTRVDQGRTHVANTTIHCAGRAQRNQCSQAEVLPIKYDNRLLDSAECGGRYGRSPDVATPTLRRIDVNGIHAGQQLVVEAIDRLCPFPGLHGTTHRDVHIYGTEMPGTTEDVTVNGKSYTLQRWQPTFPVRTEAEIVGQYGSMIINGQGPNMPVLDPTSPLFPESPYIRIGHPAPASDPGVLARSLVVVPDLVKTLPAGFTDTDYFDDFDDPNDRVTLVRTTGNVPAWMENVNYPIALYQSAKWNYFDARNEFSDFFIDRGQLLMLAGDPGQDAMSTQAMYPKRAAHLPSDGDHYLHVTYEVSHTETPRRYEQIALCGADTAGQTYVGAIPATAPLPRPGFMNQGDTARTNPLGWNCLYLTPRGAGYSVVAGGDVNSHSDTTLKVTVVRSHPAPTSMDDYDGTRVTTYATEFGPDQDPAYPHTWERSIDAAKNPDSVWLDDQQNVWLRTRFDVYISRSRVIAYVNGSQRMCTNFDASPLTMAEGALGFWHVLYHTSAEFTEMRCADESCVPQTGQHHVLHNTPFADVRNWDNVGFREDASPPSGFDATRCY